MLVSINLIIIENYIKAILDNLSILDTNNKLFFFFEYNLPAFNHSNLMVFFSSHS